MTIRTEAKKNGEKFYFSNEACAKGHLAPRYVANGVCSECAKSAYNYTPEYARRKNEYYQRNKEKAKEYARLRRLITKDQYREYRKKTKEIIYARNREWRAKNKKYLHEYFKVWRNANTEKLAVYSETRRARKANAVGRYSALDIKEIYKMQFGKCAYCRATLSQKFHADHIIPLALSGNNNRSNIQLLCKLCNLRKHASDPIVFARKLGMLL